ncbi:MAG TPA: murein L,D-transpeptidase catalytic domain family protein [Longimicrobium sp.]|nr:murein L,D-transpeptidase catalytic domain family protein [Longimicrobium sp.]
MTETYDASEPVVLADEENINETDDVPEEESIDAGERTRAEFENPDAGSDVTATAETADPAFANLDPNNVVPRKLLDEALAFFQANRARIPRHTHISILDYSKRSTERRFHVIDMTTGQVLSLRMSNGRGSEPVHNGFATRFGNVPGSNRSSLGFALTAETYHGKHGLSLRLDGLSPTNSRMRSRAVVVHGAKYVRDEAVVQGRSNGCPAVPMPQKDTLINLIKGGTLMFAGLSQG